MRIPPVVGMVAEQPQVDLVEAVVPVDHGVVEAVEVLLQRRFRLDRLGGLDDDDLLLGEQGGIFDVLVAGDDIVDGSLGPLVHVAVTVQPHNTVVNAVGNMDFHDVQGEHYSPVWSVG